MTTTIRKWINFARWSDRSNCIGKGRITNCEIQDAALMLDMPLDGVRYIGTLYQYKEDEEE